MTDYLPDKIQKHHFVIRVTNTLRLLQRKAWALLYLNARNSLDDKFHYIPLSVVANVLQAHHDEHLKESLKALSQTAVEWNITGDDGQVKSWTSSAMVGSATIEEGSTVLEYEFTEKMKQLFRENPEYATLEISVMNQFKSKHALALWEFCKIYMGTKSGSTGWKTVEQWRGVFGIQKEKYKEFKFFRFHVIEKAVNEVNEVSDIRIKPEYKRSGRSVSELRFVLKRDTKEVEKLEKTLEESKVPQLAWFEKQTKKLQEALKQEFSEKVVRYETDEAQREIEWLQYLKIKRKKSGEQRDFFMD